MSRLNGLGLLVVIGLCMVSRAQAVLRYVSPTGSGTACSSATPCSFSTGLTQALSGDELVLKNGTYQSTIFTQRAGVTIRAENTQQAIVKPPAGWNAGGGTDQGDGQFVRISHANITLRGLVIDGDGYRSFGLVTFRNGAHNGMLEHSIVRSSNSNMVKFGSVDDVVIRHNTFDDAQTEGLYVGDNASDIRSRRIQIYGNTMSRVGMHGGHGTFVDIKPTAIEVNVHHNIFENATEGPSDGCIITGSYTGLQNAFHNNIVRNSACGTALVDGFGQWVGHDVHHNVFQNLTATELYDSYAGDYGPEDGYGVCKIRENTLCSTPSHAQPVTISGVTIENNQFNAPQSSCNAEVTRIMQEMTTLPGLDPVASGSAYYASFATGNDNANCTLSTPCKTVTSLVERPLSPGDTLHLRCGETFRESTPQINTQTAGTSTAPITLRSYGPCYSHAGVHTGAANSLNLVAAGMNFSTGGVVLAEAPMLFNLTDGSSCHVTAFQSSSTPNDTLFCERGLAMGKTNRWNPGDRYSIDNRPRVTHSTLFSTGWTAQSGGVWSHTTTSHPGRHVWINGWSPHSSLWSGTCSISAMASAADRQWCTTSTAVYIKSTSNPGTRWTAPGVEVIQGASLIKTPAMLRIDHPWWRVQDIALEKIYGTIMSSSSSNTTVDNVRFSAPQRRACTTNCWLGAPYPWLSGLDSRGAESLKISTSSSLTGATLNRLLVTDCENNCLTFSGTGSITAAVTNSELFNNWHSIANLGLSSSTAGVRNLTFDRVTFHGTTAAIHSGATGPRHNTTFSNMLVYDIYPNSDARIFSLDGRDDPFGIFLEDPGTYTIRDSLITQGGHGIRIKTGTLTVDRSVIEGNRQSGINASGDINATNKTTVRLNNTAITQNGGTGLSSSSYQVGCNFAPCTNPTLYTSTSNNNKFRHGSGTDFAYVSGQPDISLNLSQWQSLYGGNSTSVTTADCFVDAAGLDYNLADGCNDIAALRGPFREITYASGTLQGNQLEAASTLNGLSPLTACTANKFAIEYNNVGQTITTCAPNTPLQNTSRFTLATAPAAGATVEIRGQYGAWEDSQRVGGFLNARSRAFPDTAITNTGVTPGCQVGTSRTLPTGTNRLLVVLLGWERDDPVTPPLSFTSCTYGGQAMTHIAGVQATYTTEPPVLADAWYINDAGITAATNTTILCTPDESVQTGRPMIVTSCAVSEINQTTPIQAFQTSSHDTNATITTAPLMTTDPGVAVQVAVSGNGGSWAPGAGWTEQLDVNEDSDPGTALHVATRNTTGTDVSGGATLTPTTGFSNRTTLVAFSLNGGTSSPPPASPQRRQLASRCFVHNEPLYEWTASQNAPCLVVSGHGLGILSEYLNEGDAEPIAVAKRLQCCVTGGECTTEGDWVEVDDVGANGVRYITTGLPTATPASYLHGTVIPSRVLSGPAMTYVPGHLHTEHGALSTPALATGEGSNIGHSLFINIPPPATVRCRLALDDNRPFEQYDAAGVTVISVVSGQAGGT